MRALASTAGTSFAQAGSPGSPTKTLPPQDAAPANKPQPGIGHMAASLGAAAVKYATSGGETVSREQFVGRQSVCKSCPQLSGARCLSCGCFIAVKAWLPLEVCPLGKWPAT